MIKNILKIELIRRGHSYRYKSYRSESDCITFIKNDFM